MAIAAIKPEILLRISSPSSERSALKKRRRAVNKQTAGQARARGTLGVLYSGQSVTGDFFTDSGCE
jgi:hypothetical protein